MSFLNYKELFLKNWKSAIAVALVSIPLSLALAIASGASPTQGLITAFWAGLIGALLGGSNYNITGPTGALSGVLIMFAITNGYEALPLLAMISGFLILLAYFLKLDDYIVFIPRSVVYGFTLGVAFIIAFGQIDNILGLQGLEKTESVFHNTITSINAIKDANSTVVIAFFVFVFFIFFWNKKFPKFPGAIVAAIVGIIISLLTHTQNSISFYGLTIGDKYPNAIGTLYEFSLPRFSLLLDEKIWIIASAVALIAILETLLSGQIADNITKTKFNRKKEVFALACANIGSGFFGGIPATAALARTAVNIKSGATDKISGVLSSLCIGIIAIFLFKFFVFLPMVVVAAILVIVAISMIEKHRFAYLFNNEKYSFFLSIIVAIITFVSDPITGILIGTVVALLIFVNKIAIGQTEILLWKNGKMVESLLKDQFLKRKQIDSDMIVYKISGTLTYVNMPSHVKTVEMIRGNDYVIVSLRHAFYADTDGVEYLKELLTILEKNNAKVFLAGVNREIEHLIIKEEFYQKKLTEGRIYKRTSEVIYDIFKK